MSATQPLPSGPGDRTRALQQALDAASDQGGGTVRLESGVHLCQGLRLRSGVELHLAAGAVLTAVGDYGAFAGNICSVIAEDSDRAFLLARDVERIAITGPGTIDGQGRLWTEGADETMGVRIPARYRPRTLVIENSRGVVLRDFRILRSPMWTIHLVDDQDVRIAALRIDNDLDHPNTDGIVVDRCRDIDIGDCWIRTADDGIVLKTSRDSRGGIRPTERVRVHGCEVQSLSCALKLGTESFGDFRNILFEDCRLQECNRGLGIFSRDGGVFRNIRFQRIHVDCRETPDGYWGSGEALTINVIDRRPAEVRAGIVEDVVVEDVSGGMQGAINLVGGSGLAVRGVTLRNVALRQRPGRLGTALSLDLRPTPVDLVPAATVTGRANAWFKDETGRVIGLVPYPGGMPGVYAENIAGLVLNNVAIDRPDPLPGLWNRESVVVTTRRSDQAPAQAAAQAAAERP
ncbi:MAG: glycoside hydrolase family 28 protein [Azospirillaceae bacterium]|nr:glycoside hydrolase family 28 protein [Azospirillaceae bacterium]